MQEHNQQKQQTTIEDLNQRGWYRLAKILYFLAFFFFAGMILLASAGFAFYKQYKGAISEWRSQVPTAEIVERVKQENPELQNLSQEAAMQEIMQNPQQYQQLLVGMQTGNINPQQMQQLGQTFQKFQGANGQDFGSYIDLGKKLIKDAPTLLNLEVLNENKESRAFFWKKFATYSIPGIIILVLLFEGTRRVVYYVTTGTLTPSKKRIEPVPQEDTQPPMTK